MSATPAASQSQHTPEEYPDASPLETVYPAPPQNRQTPPFRLLAGLFDRLLLERKPDKRRRILTLWFDNWRKDVGYDLYPVLRLMLPHKDRERTMYGLKEKSIAKTYIKLIPLGNKDPDAIRLMNWKKPTEKEKSSGDFPTVLYEVISKRSSVVLGSLTVQELNDLLDELSENDKKIDVQARILQRVYSRSTPEEQRWIVRIILRDMNISVKETTLFSVFHPDAHDLFNTCSDLKKVAWELADPKRRLNDTDKTIQLFHAFAPMLCKRPLRKVEDAVKEFGGATFIIEEKLDGERMQLHKRGNEYFYCSRKGKDYTYLYGKHVGVGSLTPFIHDAFDPRVEECILDGEMLVWDPVSERVLPFGTLKTAALDRSKKEHNPRPCFKVFDLLYLNGLSLIHKKTTTRKNNLRSCLTEKKGRIEFITQFEGKTGKDVRARMEDIMEAKGEGLILKHPTAEYVLNGRNKDWIKVKPEYMDNMGETVDVLVVAGRYGTGRRSGGVSTLLCAVLDDRRRVEEDDELKYTTFVRVGSGFSFADYVEIRARPWKDWDPKKPPTFLLTADKGIDDKGDVYLEPSESFIISVKAAEITSTTGYHLGLTMRFPRCVGIRTDLGIEDCMTASAVWDSMRTMRKRKAEEDTNIAKTKRKKVATGPKVTMGSAYSGVKVSREEVISSLFKGITFVIMSDPKSRTGMEDKAELQRTVLLHGAEIRNVANSPSYTLVYLGSVVEFNIQQIIKKDAQDILKPEWVSDSISVGKLQPFRRKYLFHATSQRVHDEEYGADDEYDEQKDPMNLIDSDHDIKLPTNRLPQRDQSATSVKEEQDPAFASWFKVEPIVAPLMVADSETESDTDPESDNDDAHGDGDVLVNEDVWAMARPGHPESGLEEVVDAPSTSITARSQRQIPIMDTDEDEGDTPLDRVVMGENDEATEYDQDRIFRHLCFYIDTPDNARMNGMVVKDKREGDITRHLSSIAELITSNGGRLGALEEPKLTHIILDKRDVSRRKELGARTSKPKRRHIVLADFVQACLDEETLLDEEGFAP